MMQAPRHIRRLTALMLAAALLLTSCGGGAKATTMHLKRTEGRVNVSDDGGKAVEPRDDLGLYNGYEVDTKSDSYAWIDLDEVKLTKLDEKTEIEIKKDGKDLEIIVNEGSLFFNVTEPLADDETMTIRASTMAVGIRGTCGWVEVPDSDTMRVFLLEGKVRCEADGKTETIRAGEMATMTEDGEITVSEFSAADIPAFVVEEIEDDDDLMPLVPEDPDDGDVSEPGTGEQPVQARTVYEQVLKEQAEVIVLFQNSGLTLNQFKKQYPDYGTTVVIALLQIHAANGNSADTLLEACDYAYYDVRGNGVDELIIGYNRQPTLMYTIRDGEAWTVLGALYTMSPSVICADGSFLQRSSVGISGQPYVMRSRIDVEIGCEETLEQKLGDADTLRAWCNDKIAQCGGEITNFNWRPLRDFAPAGNAPGRDEPKPEPEPQGPSLADYAGEYTSYNNSPITLDAGGALAIWYHN